MPSPVRVGYAPLGTGTRRGAASLVQPVPGTTSGYGDTREDSVGYTPPSPKIYAEQFQKAFGGGPKAFRQVEQNDEEL